MMYSEWCSICGRKMEKRFNGYTDVWVCKFCDFDTAFPSPFEYGNGISPYDVGR